MQQKGKAGCNTWVRRDEMNSTYISTNLIQPISKHISVIGWSGRLNVL
jgi:hypothetical protein